MEFQGKADTQNQTGYLFELMKRNVVKIVFFDFPSQTGRFARYHKILRACTFGFKKLLNFTLT